MTLTQFNQDWLPIVQTVCQVIAAIGVLMLWRQIRQTDQWNRATTQHSLYQLLPDRDHEAEFWKILQRYARDESDCMTAEAAKALYSNIEHWSCVKTYLNRHEALCAAIHSGFVADPYAYRVYSDRVCDVYAACRLYVEYVRTVGKDHEIYVELERAATRWAQRRDAQAAKIKRDAEQP